jgi:HEAT repeat protein
LTWAPLAAVLLAALGLPAAVRAEPFPEDPVESLRQALKSESLTGRRANLERRAAALHNPGELGRALVLREWNFGVTLDEAKKEVEFVVWSGIADRFERAAKEVANGNDPLAARAVADLAGELASTAHTAGISNAALAARFAQLGPILAGMTRSRDREVRLAATRALGKLDPQPEVAAKALDRLLQEEDPVLRRAAVEAAANLMRMRIAVESKSQNLDEEKEKIRPRLVEAGRYMVPVAGRALADPDPAVRTQGLTAIQLAATALGDQVVIPNSLPFPPDVNKNSSPEEIRAAQFYAEEVEKDRRELQPLIKALADQVPAVARTLRDPALPVRIQARRTVEDMAYARQRLDQRQELVPPNLPAAPPEPKPDKDESKDKDRTQGRDGGGPVLLAQVARAPAADEQPLAEVLRQATDDLVAGLSDPDFRARLAAVEALEMLGKPAATARVTRALARALGDPVLFVRWAAARTLGKLRYPETADEVVPPLAKLVTCDDDLDVRLASATALERYGPAAGAAVPDLARAVNAGDVELRVAVIRALQGIGTAAAPAIPALIEATTNPDSRVRRAAIGLLGRFGPAARDAVPALRRALDDPDPDVRRAASAALLNVLMGP